MLTLLRNMGPSSGASIAKGLGVSAQTASVILRSLEESGFVERLDPVKGKVGKPQVPYALRADGAYSVGLRLGRRSAELTLVNLLGEPVWDSVIRYPYPTPIAIDDFVRDGLDEIAGAGHCPDMTRVAGIGVAAPFELWNWLEGLGAPKDSADLWRDHAFEDAFAAFTDLPVFVGNDVNLAAAGEVMFGVGRDLTDFAYFYLGAFVGGAVVLDGRVMQGGRGNAGAFGSIPVGDTGRPDHQLIHQASIYRLERQMAAALGRPVNLRAEERLWFDRETEVRAWLETAATGLAQAIVAVAAVLDVSDVVLDGVLPPVFRTRARAMVEAEIARIDQQGLNAIRVHEGCLGERSGALGAAYQPILVRIFSG
nr:ROK family transcriptional regulator [Thalassococcus arenae]